MFNSQKIPGSPPAITPPRTPAEGKNSTTTGAGNACIGVSNRIPAQIPHNTVTDSAAGASAASVWMEQPCVAPQKDLPVENKTMDSNLASLTPSSEAAVLNVESHRNIHAWDLARAQGNN